MLFEFCKVTKINEFRLRIVCRAMPGSAQVPAGGEEEALELALQEAKALGEE
jgi:hypothetical protein